MVPTPALHETDVVAHACDDPSTWEVEARGLGIWDHLP